jgi:hypothetical protein
MAKFNINFNTDELPVSENDFPPLPAGWYTAAISLAEVANTKSGGEMIKLRWDILGPTHQGRVVFGNLNIRNSNPDAQRIGLEQLGQLLRAAGIVSLENTDQLISVTVLIKLSVKESEYQGEKQIRNEVKGYKALESSGEPLPIAGKAAAPAASGSTPPWMKK